MKEGGVSESRQPDLLDGVGLPIVVLDAHCCIVRANAAWRAAGAAAVGDVYAASDSGAARDVCEGRADNCEMEVLAPAFGGVGYKLRVVCVQAEPRLCLATHIPIASQTDELQSLREQLKVARQQLLQAQKLESVGRLSSGVAHDFNNMLTSIICFTRFVVDEMVAEDPRRADLIEVLKSADHAARLTNQLLSFSRRKPLQPVAINVNDAVTSVGRVLRRTLGDHIELVIEPSEDALWVSCDPGQLDQLLFNLAVQSKDELAADGGTIRIRLARARVNDGSVSDGDYAELSVLHKGGQAASAVEPSGLSLATCRLIAEQAQGTLQRSSEGYRVLLPAAEVKGSARRVSMTPLGLRGTALVVEDQPAILRTMARALSNAGLSVLEASSAEDALAVMESRPELDIVVTDVVLPRMSGTRLVESLRTRFPALPALFVSGYVGEDMVAGAESTVGSAFVTKPFTGRQLAVRAAALLRQR
jgi:two-component system, cell cycle sensor histidine kinase and response regulator CckA